MCAMKPALPGMKLTIDLKRGVDPEKLMQKLFRITPLEDTFSCNFNVLIAGVPRVLGVKELLNEWIAFRVECVRRRTFYDLTKSKDKLHLLQGPCENPAGYRQGDPDHPPDGGGERGCPQPDDRIRH